MSVEQQGCVPMIDYADTFLKYSNIYKLKKDII